MEERMTRNIVLLIGYRRTGKDTLADTLIRGDSIISLYPSYLTTLPKLHNPMKIALADQLKEDVKNMLGYPITEENKDKKITGQHPKGFDLDDNSTNRDVLIQHGMNMRKVDPDYWIKIVVKKIEQNRDNDIIITDCRFWNEVEYFKSLGEKLGADVITVRLFRESVTIPPLDLPSEHDLDDYHADHLLCDSRLSYKKALDIFY